MRYSSGRNESDRARLSWRGRLRLGFLPRTLRFPFDPSLHHRSRSSRRHPYHPPAAALQAGFGASSRRVSEKADDRARDPAIFFGSTGLTARLGRRSGGTRAMSATVSADDFARPRRAPTNGRRASVARDASWVYPKDVRTRPRTPRRSPSRPARHVRSCGRPRRSRRFLLDGLNFILVSVPMVSSFVENSARNRDCLAVRR